ncbi:Oxysterol-binding protein 4 [Balamuthia mandrillaris]
MKKTGKKKEDNSPKTYDRMEGSSPNGGMLTFYNDEEGLKRQRGVIWEILKQVGASITSVKEITNVSLPVTVFEPRSYLQRLCDGWWSAPIFLNKAAQTTDPVERLKLVVTFTIAGFHNTCGGYKPFNPILGETFQAQFEDGTEVFAEQSSHHPPVTTWQLIGPGGCYQYHGYGEWIASFRGNSAKGAQKGPNFIDFPDGTSIRFSLPELWVRGMVWGERVQEYCGVIEYRDEKNDLSCDVFINPKEGGFLSGWFSKKTPADYFKGEIRRGALEDDSSEDVKSGKKKRTESTVICTIEGSWVSCIEFDGERYWDFKQNLPKHVPKPVDDPLPSDSRFREDLCFLAAGDLQQSGLAKTRLEEKQRYEARLRREGAELRKKEPAKEPRVFRKADLEQAFLPSDK